MGKPITKEGYDKVKEKLSELKAEFDTLPAIIAEAREKGDLKENAEYHAAREKQGLLQAQISKLESDLAVCEIVDPSKMNKDIVTFGKRVKVKDKNSNAVSEYRIVGELEADMSKNEITIVTPIARGLLTKKVGDVVTIKVPAGDKVLEILEISL
ncbi:transcription elongation factor GreA [Brachyspira pilosicoli]|uniref:Transcription elongation factor GreA n=5 Tax=Brachyspira pilosicoli TaxID=52584 RepID=D8IFK4_BRAP9|nr:transcription elongation factor GreA [Brachyspira pilosicoli]ADK31927.1 GreA/GreB family elongation factor [Brachyspira pilosicoli 95/1000]AFR71227.1 transcription elongation factor GreA [Brachyspira pilosicoli B2904]AGA66338.1 GreA/GreB family elongation factor [Brachyspira pilosicoli P43/6/78]MBW5377483.1 transcription elongation factor GreA [Brachyspira pilosicoli]MBW5381797.1 transcription elongation factor GreA [Brachyspira pilosicoli]